MSDNGHHKKEECFDCEEVTRIDDLLYDLGRGKTVTSPELRAADGIARAVLESARQMARLVHVHRDQLRFALAKNAQVAAILKAVPVPETPEGGKTQ